MINLVYIVVVLAVVSFALVGFFGAPFLPTRKKWAEEALELVELNKADVVVDLGSGNGTVLNLLARRNIKSIGYELNPVLWMISKLRFIFSKLVKVKLANFWKQDLPKETTVVYIFAITGFTKKLEEYFKKQSQARHFKVIMFGFKLPTKKIIKQTDSAFLYHF